MTIFSIDAQNIIARHASIAEVPEGGAIVSNETELATVAESWPVTRLVAAARHAQ